MSRLHPLSSPFLIGFDDIERALERVSKGSEGYPPYNIERLLPSENQPDRLRITLAVAGFTKQQLEMFIEDSQLIIRGRQLDDEEPRHFLHKGIANRQFQRIFLLADGMEVMSADLKHGLLMIDLVRPQPERVITRININYSE
jgi:HSP20 family molecular chaperone IbpA